MLTIFVLSLSIALQFLAAFLAVRLIRVTRAHAAWLLIAAAVLLMAIRRTITLGELLLGNSANPPSLSAELVALLISVFMVAGVYLIRPLFTSIQRNEERFRQVTENIKETFWLTDLKGEEMIYVSPAYERIWGRTCESLYAAPKSYLNNIHGADRDRVIAALERQESGAFDETYRIVRPDGSIRWVRDRAFPVKNAQGQVYRLAGIAEDITEEMVRDERMKKLSGALEQAADAVMITDVNGIIEYVNPAFTQMTGYSRSELLGEHADVIKSGQHDYKFYRDLWHTVLRGEVYRNVLVNRRKDGSLYYEEKTISPLKDRGGRITHFIATGEDISERMRAQERLHFLAYHDVVTELPNRALFLDRLNHALSRRMAPGQRLAVLFLDLDQFKSVNDTLGHEVGDMLLRELPARFTGCIRQGDTLARFGGDEFAILLENMVSEEPAVTIAEKLLAAMVAPLQIDGHELFVTTSIGISLYPDDAGDAITLLKHADSAMYRAKEQGRNNFQFYSADMGERVHQRLRLETDLRRAVDARQFVLHYQPLVDLATGRITGMEALLRWRHPTRGIVGPLEFVPLLEDTGMIVPLGRWVIETACRDAQDWRGHAAEGVVISINVSSRQLRDSEFAMQVQHIIEAAGVPATMLSLELTESVLLLNERNTLDNLQALDRLGVRLTVDDFGTGYSSLSYLKRFPIRGLKIDRSFIGDLPDDVGDATICTAIIAMAKSLDLEVIAEGVEQQAQLAFLQGQGCDSAQGYLLSPPLPAEQVREMLSVQAPLCAVG